MFKNNQAVMVRSVNVNGRGKVIGLGSGSFPLFGVQYIVKMDDPEEAGIDPKWYPYSALLFSGTNLEEVKEDVHVSL
jgi:hypothetical protein